MATVSSKFKKIVITGPYTGKDTVQHVTHIQIKNKVVKMLSAIILAN